MVQSTVHEQMSKDVFGVFQFQVKFLREVFGKIWAGYKKDEEFGMYLGCWN